MLEDLLPEENKNIEPTELTEDQKKIILLEWDKNESAPPSIKHLTNLIFGSGLDGRSKQSKLIKEYLGTMGLKATVSYEYQAKGDLDLNEEQKEFIVNNCASMTPLEMAEILFNKKLTNLSQETRTIINFVKTLDNRVKFVDPKNLVTDTYKAPKSDTPMIDRINKYIDTPIDKSQYGKNDRQKKWVQALIGYINSYRFIQTINNYETEDDRDLFESSFISYVYGKDDLTAEERDQYILLCSEVVSGKHITARINKYERIADESIDGNSDDGRKLSMTFVEAISNLRKEHNDCVKRQQSLIDDLKGKRSTRLKDKIKENESLVGLVEFWVNEETRKRLIDANIIRRSELKEEAKRLTDMDSLKFEIWGVDVNEIINN